MNDQLNQLKKKLKREDQQKADSDEKVDALANEKTEAKDGVDSEREEVLSAGKRFVRPLTMNPQKALRVTLLIILGLIILIVASFAVMIYRFQSDSDLVYRASQVIPYPAAKIDNRFVGYDDYLFELRFLKQSSENPIAGGEGVDFDTEEGQEQLENLRILALNEAQRKAMVRQIAREKGVKVSRGDVQEEVDRLVEFEGGQDQLEDALDLYYNWSMRDLRSVLHSLLLQKEITKQRAEEVLAEVQEDDADFAELAAEHSSDGSAADGGDIGYVTGDGTFVEEFEQAALVLGVGEVSEVVETDFGFHILKATEHDEDEGVRISHILIDPSYVQQMVTERLDEADRSTYIGVPLEPEAVEPQFPEGVEVEEAQLEEADE